MSTTKTKPLTKALLAGIMDNAMVVRERPSLCIEDWKQPGIYTANATCYTTEPVATPGEDEWKYSTIEVISRGVDVIQRLTHIEGVLMFIRVYRNGAWRPWRRIETVAV